MNDKADFIKLADKYIATTLSSSSGADSASGSDGDVRYKKIDPYTEFVYWANQCDEYFKIEHKYNPLLLLCALKKKKSCNFIKKAEEETTSEDSNTYGSYTPIINISEVKLKFHKVSTRNEKISDRLVCEDKQLSHIPKSEVKISSVFPFYQIIFNAISTLLGIFFMCLLLYKFTSIGSWLYKKNQRKTEKV
ncbi:PIR Superfamily Protein [Plasmodium ovale curtisi]|uniref:PIR Superfamily Protein n=1 Tax=Plasmodium ovale curtisi TaxID=864141 RepID=A0A1A8WKJ1_PLAOA|nr:PIR Superfamily Protein [Plasmodium ovale curtisi]